MLPNKPLLDQAILKSLLDYDPETGRWTSRRTGKSFGSIDHVGRKRPYLRIDLPHGRFYAHRLAYLYMLGEWPPAQIDHINHDTLDNRWANLRPVSRAQNQWNTEMLPDHPTGIFGVWFEKARGKWCVQMKRGKQPRFGGRYSTFADAVAARLAAEQEYRIW